VSASAHPTILHDCSRLVATTRLIYEEAPGCTNVIQEATVQ
jgi:hypothetical protein